MSFNEKFPIFSSLQKNSQLGTFFISALTISNNRPIKNDELQQRFLNKGVQLNRCYRTAAILIDDSEKFLQRYERIHFGMLGVNGPPNPVNEWTGDCQKLHELIGTQEYRTTEQINHLLFEASSLIDDLRAGDLNSAISRDIWTLFAKREGAVKESMDRVNEISWTKMAGQALNDIQRLMRHVGES